MTRRDVTVNALVVLGLALICGGLGWLWLPVGVVATGVSLLALAVLIGLPS